LYTYNVNLSNSNKVNQQSENENMEITIEQNENVESVNKQSELTINQNVKETKISTRGTKITVSNKYKDYVCN
jgi:hypothetical protein